MTHQWVRFGDFQLDLETTDLLGDDGPVDLQPLPSRILTLLVSRPGVVVTRDEIKREIWGETTFAVDQALNAAIRQVRIALGDSATEPCFVATVPRRGYRFVALLEPGEGPAAYVEPVDAGTTDAAAAATGAGAADIRSSSADTRRRAFPYVLAGAAAVLVALSVGLDQLAGSRGPGDDGTDLSLAAMLPEDLRLEYLKAREFLGELDRTAWSEAAAAFDSVRERRPDFLPATAGAGHAALRLGDHERAAGFAAWTLATDSLNGEAHMVLGTTLLQRGEWKEARTALERARSLAPDLVASYTGLAVLAALEGRSDAAFRFAEAALDVDPLSAITLGDAGYVALWTDRPERALRWCGHALDLQTDGSTPRYCLLDAYHILGRPEPEREQAVAIMRQTGAPATLVREVETASAEQGLRSYRLWQMKRLDPTGSEPPSRAGHLAFLHMQGGDRDAALRLLEIAAEADPVRFRLTLLDPVFEPLREDPRLRRLVERAASQT